MGSNPEVTSYHIIYFDGVCNLCDGLVNEIIDQDDSNLFKFSSLQSDFARSSLSESDLDIDKIDSIILWSEGAYFIKSQAVFRIAQILKGKWFLIAMFRWIPTKLADYVYDIVARNRYRWFGKLDSCKIPTPELESRFLDS
ncbi:MAG: DUF393 domain-containing protein [Cyclobacteriaceae bacterium]